MPINKHTVPKRTSVGAFCLTNGGKLFVTIYEDGTVEIGRNCTPITAAREFWRQVYKQAPAPAATEELRMQCCTYRDMLNDVKDCITSERCIEDKIAAIELVMMALDHM